jgi:phospholipid N-methyltransferase
MTRDLRLRPGRDVIEMGPGEGALTAKLLTSLPPDSHVLGIEINPTLVRSLQEATDDPRLRLAVGDAIDVEELARHYLGRPVQTIVAGLPWANIPFARQRSILESVARLLTCDGEFRTFAYLPPFSLRSAQSLSRLTRERFRRVEVSRIIWRNIPPAVVISCVGPLRSRARPSGS